MSNRIGKWLVENGYMKDDSQEAKVGEPVVAEVAPSGNNQGTQPQSSPQPSTEPVRSVVTSVANPEQEKFENIFLSALRRSSPKLFEFQELLHKFEQTIGTERERYATALIMLGVSQQEMIAQIDALVEALAGEEKTATSQISATGDRNLSDKKGQVTRMTENIESLKQQLMQLEDEKRKLENDIGTTQQATEETVVNVKRAAEDIRSDLVGIRGKVGSYCVTQK